MGSGGAALQATLDSSNRCDLAPVRHRPWPRYMPGVVKPHAASPDGATAISPPLPPSAADIGQHRVERRLQRLAAEPHPQRQLVRRDGADEMPRQARSR